MGGKGGRAEGGCGNNTQTFGKDRQRQQEVEQARLRPPFDLGQLWRM